MKLISILAIISFFAMSCTKSTKIEYGLDSSETLRINLTQEPPTLDWNKSSDTTSSQVIGNLMSGLVDFNINDPELSVKPALAEKWESSKDAKTWTFTLRKDVKWSDGQGFVAKHVVDGWQRLLAPETASQYAYFLFNVKNAQSFSEGKIKDFSQVGVKAKDDYTLEVSLENPVSFFPYLLTHVSTFPIRLDVIEKHKDKWTDPANIVTLGAYNLKVWDHDKAIVFERNPNYFGTPASTKNILAYMISELSTAINLFESGKIDALNEIPKSEIRTLSQKPEHRSISQLVLQYYGFNTKKAPFDNVDVRKAFALGIDKNEIVQVMGSGDIALRGWIPAGMFGYETNLGLDFNPAEAKKLLQKAGYGEGGKAFPKIKLAFNTNENHQRVAENVQAQIKRNLGIELELMNEEWKVYLNTLQTDTPHIFRMGWQADYPDPDNFINLMMSNSGNNRTGWGNKEFDQYVIKAVSEMDKEKRRELYLNAQKILVEQDIPAIPLFSTVHHKLVSGRVKNYPINAIDQLDYKQVVISK